MNNPWSLHRHIYFCVNYSVAYRTKTAWSILGNSPPPHRSIYHRLYHPMTENSPNPYPGKVGRNVKHIRRMRLTLKTDSRRINFARWQRLALFRKFFFFFHIVHFLPPLSSPWDSPKDIYQNVALRHNTLAPRRRRLMGHTRADESEAPLWGKYASEWIKFIFLWDFSAVGRIRKKSV